MIRARIIAPTGQRGEAARGCRGRSVVSQIEASQPRRPQCAKIAKTSALDTAAHHAIEIANNHVPRVIGRALRWSSQFALEPARCFRRFHRIIRRFEHANVIASWTFKCSNVETERAWPDPCQHRHRFALRTWWSVERAHDEVPLHQAGAQNSQSPVGAVIER
jgi:hypothetical protein